VGKIRCDHGVSVTSRLSEVKVEVVRKLVELSISSPCASVVVELTPDQCDSLAELLPVAARDARG
jgi:hypothetical protein